MDWMQVQNQRSFFSDRYRNLQELFTFSAIETVAIQDSGQHGAI